MWIIIGISLSILSIVVSVVYFKDRNLTPIEKPKEITVAIKYFVWAILALVVPLVIIFGVNITNARSILYFWLVIILSALIIYLVIQWKSGKLEISDRKGNIVYRGRK